MDEQGDRPDDELDRLRRTERRLRSLQRTTRELMVATSREGIAEATLTACREVLDQPIASVWYYRDDEDALVRLGQTPESDEAVDSPDAFGRGEGLVWEVYESGKVRTYDDLRDEDETYNPETPLRSELMAPVGEYGIVLAASRQPSSFDDLDLDMGEILAANVEAAFERLERERTLRDRQRDLELLRQILSRLLRHNFRNRITLIRGQADRILDRVDDLAPADGGDPTGAAGDDGAPTPGAGSGAEAAERIRDSAETIRGAAADLDDWSEKARRVGRLVDRDPTVERHDLKAVVEEALASVDVPPGATVERAVSPGTTVLAVPQLARAVENLLENAVVHGGTAPTVRVTASETDGRVELVVADDGPGIPEEEIEVFERGEETPLRHSSGMGLWLVAWIVGRSDGEFYVERDGGTRAVVRLQTGSDPER